MPDVVDSDRVAQACAYLRILLTRQGEYRHRWERQVAEPGLAEPGPAEPGPAESSGEQAVSEQAVGAVLTEAPATAAPAGLEPAGLGPGQAGGIGFADAVHVETARRALAGSALHPDDLELFVSAFGLTQRHANRLRQLRRGAPQLRVLAGDERLTPEVERLAVTGHQMVSVHDSHTIGPDRCPVEHESLLVIRSAVPLLESVPYRFDTNELVVQVVRGGRVGESMYRVSDTIWGIDLVLDRPLRMGETALLQVHTTFSYRQPPEPEFRRGILESTSDLTMWVRFHPQRTPEQLWIARWDRLDQARIVEREPVELDGEFSARMRFGQVERAVVGFTWEWEGAAS